MLHRFSIQVMAAELDGTVQPVEVSEGQAIPIAMGGVSDGWSMGFPGNGCVSYSFSLPFRCVGEDISTITYDINKGDFFIEHPVEDGYVVSGFPASEGDLTDSFELEPGFAAEKYDSYTVNYDYQSADGVCVYLQDFLYDRPDIVELITYPEPDDLECTKRFVMAISKLMEDKIMTVTATFTDGTTEECHIVFGASLVYTELGVESERIEASYLTTIVCMVGKEDMNATTSVLSVVNEEDWWLDKRVVKVGDDVIVEKQKRIIGSEESEWSADWYADRETLHITEDSPLLGLHIKDSLNLDETSEYEEYRYVILSIPQTPEIVYGDQVNMYLGAHIPNNSK